MVLLQELTPGGEELRARAVAWQRQHAEELRRLPRQRLGRSLGARGRAAATRRRLRPALRDVQPPAEIADDLGVGRVLAPLATEPLAVQPPEEAFEPERELRRHAALVGRERVEERLRLVLVERAVQRPPHVHGLAEPRPDALEQRSGWGSEWHGMLVEPRAFR